jgi:hypothetical protein
MELVRRGQALSASNPLLVYSSINLGLLTDITGSLKFEVFDISDEVKQLTPVRVFPGSNQQSINLTTDRVSKGRYAASGWTVSGSQALGRHEIRWYVKTTPSASEVIQRKEFEVLPDIGGLNGAHYCSVSDLRDEGMTTSMLSDLKAFKVINRVSRYIERVTGRIFEAQYRSMFVDGTAGPCLFLDDPVIGVEALNVHVSPYEPEGYVMPDDIYVVYNRHLGGLRSPDDRDHPRIELLNDRSNLFGYVTRSDPPIVPHHAANVWNPGVQNVKVTGVFGYTDPDGSPWGATPEQLKHCAKLLCFREFPQMGSFDDREERKERWRIRGERTEDQSVNFETLKHQGVFTGDNEIDYILAQYTRPPQLAAV